MKNSYIILFQLFYNFAAPLENDDGGNVVVIENVEAAAAADQHPIIKPRFVSHYGRSKIVGPIVVGKRKGGGEADSNSKIEIQIIKLVTTFF